MERGCQRGESLVHGDSWGEQSEAMIEEEGKLERCKIAAAGTETLQLQLIKEQLDADSVTVKDAYGDGRHVSIDVISSAFEGQSTLNRQRMVYKAIWEELQNTVHAVD